MKKKLQWKIFSSNLADCTYLFDAKQARTGTSSVIGCINNSMFIDINYHCTLTLNTTGRETPHFYRLPG